MRAWHADADFDFTSLEWLLLHHRVKRPHREALVAGLSVEPGSRWVDLGCGPGTITRLLARHAGPNGHVVGVDLDEGLLEHARSTANVSARVLRYLQADVRAVPLASDSFDAGYCANTLGYISNSDEVIAELRRMVKPGGRVICQHWDDTLWCFHPAPRGLVLRVLAGVADAEESHELVAPFDTGFGRRMHGILVGSGLIDVKTEVVPFPLMGPLTEDETEYIRTNALWLLERAKGFVSLEDVDGWLGLFGAPSCAGILSRPDVFFCELEIVTSGVVPH